MNDTVFVFIALSILAIGLLALWYYLRQWERRNNVLTVEEASLNWKEVRCVNCQKTMEKGYSFAGRGITWVPKYAKKPGAFSTIGSVLENTYSLRVSPALNMAWYCKSCKIVVLDNSKMLKIKNAQNPHKTM